jgi:uncharacterized protein (UPF0335 family)
VSCLPDPLHVISKPGSGAWQAAAVEKLRLKKEPKAPALTCQLLWLHTCAPVEEGARMTNTAGIPGDRICSFIDRVERIDEEIKALNEDKKEVFAEAKGEGFDVKVLREILRLRKQDKDEHDEQESLLDLYLRAMESAGSSQTKAA